MDSYQVLFRTLPFVGILLGLEAVAFLVSKRRYDWREAASSLSVFAIGAVVKPFFIILPLMVGAEVYKVRLFTVPAFEVWSIALLFLTMEFLYYWQHRFGHTVRWFWASHSVHHSPTQLQIASAYRLSWTAAASGVWIFYLPLSYLGFDPVALRLMIGLNLLYQLPLHTDFIPRLGFLEKIFNTPSNHRVHHASNPEYLDKNFGGILIVFDRMFGTYQPEEKSRAITYGLVNTPHTLNPFVLNFREWFAIARDARQARTVRAKAAALFGPPGGYK
jgi:sterol desaturase/sphingolipid hydroxylase (fatty acid hydroxylase superfamily)